MASAGRLGVVFLASGKPQFANLRRAPSAGLQIRNKSTETTLKTSSLRLTKKYTTLFLSHKRLFSSVPESGKAAPDAAKTNYSSPAVESTSTATAASLSNDLEAQKMEKMQQEHEIQLAALKRVVAGRPPIIMPILTLIPLSLTSFGIVSVAFYAYISNQLSAVDGLQFAEQLRLLGVYIPQELMDTNNIDELTAVIMRASMWYRVVGACALVPVFSSLVNISKRKSPTEDVSSVEVPVQAATAAPVKKLDDLALPEQPRVQTTTARPGKPQKTIRFGGLDEILQQKAARPKFGQGQTPPDPDAKSSTTSK